MASAAPDAPDTLKRRIRAHVNWIKKRIEEVDSLTAFVSANPTSTSEGKITKLVDKLEGHVDAIEENTAALLEALDIVQKHKIPLSPTNERLFVANSEEMPCEGVLTFIAKVNAVETRIEALVTSSMSNEILVCWQDLMNLNVIPKDFPCNMYHINSAVDTSSLIDIFRNFDDVLNEQVSLKAMKGHPMHIYLHDGAEARPSHVLVSRAVPLHMREAAEKEVKKLIKYGILVKVEPHEKTAWISPAFFVPKPNGELRLVNDFTKLNKFVVRPVHPFMFTEEILNSIECGSKLFCVLDCVKGYFQVELDEESSKLTTMLLPWGRYRYTRAPMGLSCSSDEWCARSDRALQVLDIFPENTKADQF